jgi:hypothetical protein
VEALLPSRRHRGVITLRAQRRCRGLRELPFAFDDQDPH